MKFKIWVEGNVNGEFVSTIKYFDLGKDAYEYVNKYLVMQEEHKCELTTAVLYNPISQIVIDFLDSTCTYVGKKVYC